MQCTGLSTEQLQQMCQSRGIKPSSTQKGLLKCCPRGCEWRPFLDDPKCLVREKEITLENGQTIRVDYGDANWDGGT